VAVGAETAATGTPPASNGIVQAHAASMWFESGPVAGLAGCAFFLFLQAPVLDAVSLRA
jgi:hypothetical protein